MSRDELLHLIDYAKTKAEVDIAFAEAKRWLEDHPDDMEVRGSLEGLAMLDEALELI